MKKNRALGLVVAASLTIGAAVVPLPLASGVEIGAQTMADLYDPYFTDLAFKESESYSATMILSSHEPLPTGTTATLLTPNRGENSGESGGVRYSVYSQSDGNPYIRATIGLHGGFDPEGNTSSPTVIISYPDGSTERVTANITIVPKQSRTHYISFGHQTVLAGTTATLKPNAHRGILEGTKFLLGESDALEKHLEMGWRIAVDSGNGEITVSVPKDAATNNLFSIPVTVLFPDGSTEATSIGPSVVDRIPSPNDYVNPNRPQGSSFGSSS